LSAWLTSSRRTCRTPRVTRGIDPAITTLPVINSPLVIGNFDQSRLGYINLIPLMSLLLNPVRSPIGWPPLATMSMNCSRSDRLCSWHSPSGGRSCEWRIPRRSPVCRLGGSWLSWRLCPSGTYQETVEVFIGHDGPPIRGSRLLLDTRLDGHKRVFSRIAREFSLHVRLFASSQSADVK
jgi:hypothetical protein